MPITMGGVASGVNTDEMITKLLNVEAQPLQQMQQEKVEYRQRISALEKLESKLRNLNRSAKDLYGFRASYDDKIITSSHPQIVEATASKLAEKGTRYVTVVQLAGTHKITTDRIEKTEQLDGGVLRIDVNGNEESLTFRGGTLEKLKESIDDTFADTVSASLVNTGSASQVLVLESKKEGKKGEMKITGDLPFLRKIGLVDGYKDEEKDQVNLVFDTTYFQDYTGRNRELPEDGSLSVAEDGKSFEMTGVLWREYMMATPYSVKEETVLEF
ncbi:MAG: flagellar cap protein FliD N-terminal domain-containing protein [Spirochaetota bacterium]